MRINNCIISEATSASSIHEKPTVQAAARLIAQAIGQLRENISSMQTCCNETKQLIAEQVQVFRERKTTDKLAAESLQTLHIVKESMGQSLAAAGRTAEELALMRKGISAAMNTLSEELVLVNETKTSQLPWSAANTSELTATCRNLAEKLHYLTESSAEEYQKTGKRLEAIERILHNGMNEELDIKESLKRLNDSLNEGVCRDISFLGNYLRAFFEDNLCTSEPF